MLRFIGILCLIITAVTSLGLLVVRAQDMPDTAVNDLLTGSDECHSPCWMGIEIGQARADDAARLLESHPWVSRVIQTNSAVIWRWNGQQPALINGTQDGLLKVVGGIVKQVRVQTYVPFGAVWLLLTRPDDVLLVRPMSRYSAFQIASYADAGIQVISTISCPVDPADFWAATTTLGIGEIWTTEALNGRSFNIYDEAGWWHSLRRCAVIGE